jgi:hypothetical protein
MVEAATTNKLSHAAVEQVNTQIRLITQRGSATAHPGPPSPSPCSRSPASAHPFATPDTTHGSCRRFNLRDVALAAVGFGAEVPRDDTASPNGTIARQAD